MIRRDLVNALRKKRPALLENLIFHQDNAPVHKAHVTMDLLAKLGYPLLEHPPYSPDLAPCDFAIFPTLKKFMRGTHYEDILEIKQTAVLKLRSFQPSFFRNTFENWVKRHELCIEHNGAYFEKE